MWYYLNRIVRIKCTMALNKFTYILKSFDMSYIQLQFFLLCFLVNWIKANLTIVCDVLCTTVIQCSCHCCYFPSSDLCNSQCSFYGRRVSILSEHSQINNKTPFVFPYAHRTAGEFPVISIYYILPRGAKSSKWIRLFPHNLF